MLGRRTFSVDAFVPLLVGLLDAEHNPDAMLLAARALTHLADVLPPARASIVHHGALPGTPQALPSRMIPAFAPLTLPLPAQASARAC